MSLDRARRTPNSPATLFDVGSRTVQLAFIHPGAVPAGLAALLPGLPAAVPQTAIDSLLALRLPH